MNEETIVFRGSPSLATRFGPLFLGALVLAGSVTGAVLLWPTAQQPAAYGLAGLGLLALIYLLGVILVVKSTAYEVTSERIRIRRGIFTKRTDEVELYRANDTSLIEPLAMRLIGLGTIEVRTMETGSPSVQIEAIRGARGVRESLRKHIEECRDRKRVRITELDEPSPPGEINKS